jgi:hypothetical protein
MPMLSRDASTMDAEQDVMQKAKPRNREGGQRSFARRPQGVLP